MMASNGESMSPPRGATERRSIMASNGGVSSPSRRAERPSTEIIHSLFGTSVGRCWGDFSCSHYRQRGRLYAASNAIAFFSNLFGFERKICLHLDDVTDIKAFRTTSIQITTVEGEQYIFKSFENRELVVLLLLQLKQGHSNGSTRQRSDSAESVERLDPLETSIDVPMDSEEAEETTKQLTDSLTALETLSSTVQEDEPESPGHASEAGSAITEGAIVSELPSVLPEEELEAATENLLENSTENLPEAVSLEIWESAKNANDPPYNETSIDRLLLPCTLDEFFALFLADNAPHSIDKYQRNSIGDSELTISPWKAEPDGIHERAINFRHPLPNGLGVGPPSALAERRQRFRRYGSYGFCLETSTSVKGVIASDCFFVDDKWIVELDKDETSVTLTVKHQVRFTKRTMLKRVIQNTSNSEAQKWFAGYSKMLLASLEDKGSKEMETEELEKDQAEPIAAGQQAQPNLTAGNFPSTLFVTLLWGFLMAGTGFLLLQMTSMHHKLVSLEDELVHLREENLQAFARLEEAIGQVKQTADCNHPAS